MVNQHYLIRLLLSAQEWKAYISLVCTCKQECSFINAWISSISGKISCWLLSLFFFQVYLWIQFFFFSFSCFRVVCKCEFCGSEKQALSEWERHTGSKIKNWRTSIRVKDSMLPLEQWVCTESFELLSLWIFLLSFMGRFASLDGYMLLYF
jgi:hypothetical protein